MHTLSVNKKDMILKGNLTKNLLVFCYPLVVISLLNMMYNTVDTVVVGQYLGKDALAAVGQVGVINALLNGFLMGFSTGAGIIISNVIGSGDRDRIQKVINTSIAVAIVLGIVGSLLGVIASPLFIKLIDMDSSIQSMGVSYLSILLSTIVLSMLYNIGAQVMRSYGENTLPLVFFIIGLLINLGLDLLFVGVLNMGVSGAAVATLIAITIKIIILFVHMLTTKREYRLDVKRILNPDHDIVKLILKKGLPIGLQSSMFQIANLYVTRVINGIPGGTEIAAGWSVNSKFENIFFGPIMASSGAVTIFVAQNLGAGNYDRAIESSKKGALIEGIGILIMTVVCCGLARPLIHIFSEDTLVTDNALRVLYLVAPAYIFFALQDVACATIKASGDTVRPFIYSLISILVGRVVWLSIMPLYWNTIECVALSYPISWLCAAIVSGIRWLSGTWLKRYQDEHQQTISQE